MAQCTSAPEVNGNFRQTEALFLLRLETGGSVRGGNLPGNATHAEQNRAERASSQQQSWSPWRSVPVLTLCLAVTEATRCAFSLKPVDLDLLLLKIRYSPRRTRN